MKKLIFVLFSLMNFIAFGQDSTNAIKKITIPEGSIIRVKSLSSFSSKTVNEGDIVDFAVIENLEINGVVVIKENTIVNAYIENSEKAKGVGKEGSLKVQFNYTKAIDGSKVPLRSTKGTIEGDNKGGSAVALAVVVSPLFLLKKGKEAKVAEGKIMDAYVLRDVIVTLK